MIVLVLDPAESTGYALARFANSRAEIYRAGFIDVDTSSEYQGDHCIDLMRRLGELIDTERVDRIGVEDYFFSRRSPSGATVNAAYRTAIHILARQRNIPYSIINITAWKNFVAGSSKPTKPQKKLWKTKANKLMIQDALWKKYKIRFPNHSQSETTGKPIAFRLDIVDAVGQMMYFLAISLNIPVANVAYTVPIVPDIVWKKQPKYLYQY